MTERLLQFIWQFQYFNRGNLTTTAGEVVEIIFPGKWNHNQGPDFSDARIKVGGTLLAGSVELHLKTSEWQKHGHQQDANYKNVILHVVLEHDLADNNYIPVVELQTRISKLLLDKYGALMQETAFIPCAATIAQTKDLALQSWKERLVAERLSRKANNIYQILKTNNNHWEATFWQLLARNFGIKVNADAFEEIAQTIPVTLLAKNKNGIHQLEALLLGQAGLLQGNFSDAYSLLLQREYQFLKNKYSLKPIHAPIHFLRMRPFNFPTVRLAQLAMLVHQSEHLFSKVLQAQQVKEVKQWLQVTANDYWHYHYRLDVTSAYLPKKLGAGMIDNIIINTIVPMLFAYGVLKNDEHFQTKALQWLEQTSAESNSITNGFTELSLVNKSAFDSQAFIELKNEYCNNRRCLECAVGYALLKKTNN